MEEWRESKVCPGTKISSLGRMMSRFGHINIGYSAAHGYLRTERANILGQKSYAVHRLVLFAFVGDPPAGMIECNHKNGIKHDNRVENLEWSNRSKNIKHAYANGLLKPTRRSPRYGGRLDLSRVRQIKLLLTNRLLSRRDISCITGVGVKIIGDISTGKTWKNL